MLTARARLKLKPSTDTRGRAYIVADAAALRTLAQACELAARGAVGIEICTLYAADGHPYEIFITREVTEDEWQQDQEADAIESVAMYDSVKQQYRGLIAPQ
jgi:hypothetical protein